MYCTIREVTLTLAVSTTVFVDSSLLVWQSNGNVFSPLLGFPSTPDSSLLFSSFFFPFLHNVAHPESKPGSSFHFHWDSSWENEQRRVSPKPGTRAAKRDTEERRGGMKCVEWRNG
jgi:hypothetical protein